jgi:signal transduction histidine kinase
MKRILYIALMGATSLMLVAFLLIHAQNNVVIVEEPEFSSVVMQSQEDATNTHFDIKKKNEHVKAVVKKGVAYFNDHTLVDTCKAFSYGKDFKEGDVYLFILDMQGRFLAHGREQDLIWRDYYNYRDSLGAPFVQEIIQKASQGGSWITYEWRGSTKVTWAEAVQKGEDKYIVGAGYYPHAKEDTVVTLVKGAVAVVNKDLREDRPMEQAFSTISYRLGRFVVGDLYLYALRFDGLQVAHENQDLVGQYALDYKDSSGLFVNKEIIQKLNTKKVGEGIWIDYQSNNAQKRAYAEKIVDKNGTEYFIACGYYPDIKRENVIELVRRGYQYMKSHGLTQAVKEFTRDTNNSFSLGELSLFVYGVDGTLVADVNEALIGRNMINQADEDARLYIKEMIKKAENGGGWVDFKFNKSFKSIYVEKVQLGADFYVVGSGLYPVSKSDTMQLLVKSAISYVQTNPLGKAFEQFVDNTSSFMRGDLYISVFDTKGNCYAYGDQEDLVWVNMIKATDDNGKEYIRLLIAATEDGPARITYQKYNREVVAYAERVDKDGLTLIVSSHFYM